MNNKSFLKWLQLTGLVLLVYILSTLDINKILINISKFDFKYVFVYGLLTLIMVILKSIRWGTLLKKQNIRLPLKKIIAIVSVTSFWGILTPGRLGEAGKLLYIKNDEVSFVRSIVSIVIDRSYDILFLLLMGAVSVFFFMNLLSPYFNFLPLIIIFTVAMLILLYLIRGNLWALFKKALKVFLPHEKYQKLVNDWDIFKNEFIYLLKSTVPKVFSLTFLISACYYLQIYVVAVGFGVHVSFIYLALCLSAGALVSLIPISIGGLGTREAVFIFLLAKVSIPAENAVLISFFDGNVLSLVMFSILAGVSTIVLKDMQKHN